MPTRAAFALIAVCVLRSHTFGTAARRPLVSAECTSETCYSAASRIQDFVDESASPCDDFYKFACGGWINRTSVPGSQSAWDQFLVLREQLLLNVRDLLCKGDEGDDVKPLRQARALYNMCLDTDALERRGVEPLLGLMAQLGLRPWPAARRQLGGTRFDWVRVVARAQRLLGLNLLFKFWVGQDVRNSSRNVMMIDQGSYSISLEYLMDRTRFHKEVEAYRRYIRDMVNAFEEASACAGGDQADGRGPRPKVSLGKSFAQDILRFGVQLSRIVRSREARRDSGPVFHEKKISEVEKLMEVKSQSENVQMDWARYLRGVFAGTDVVLDAGSDVILAMEPEYLQRLSALVARTPASTLERFLWWNVFVPLAPLTLSRFRQLAFQLGAELYGVTEDTPRWKTCSQTVNSHFGMAVSQLYVRKHFDDKCKTKALEMVEHIRNAFTDHVWELPWMDDQTKRTAVEKAHAMRTFIGYPDWLASAAELQRYYRRAEIVDGEFFESILKLAEISVETSLQEIRTTPNPDRWIMPATTVNAFYSPVMNSMTFPAGILQQPFYNLGLLSLNYGAIGSIMGHELTHGFDDQGRRFDKLGNMRQWWTETTLREYQARVRCFVKQYSGYGLPELKDNFFVNGITTQGENIADNGGMRQALWAYRTLQAHRSRGARSSLPGFAARYSPDQLFFLGFAHMWCGKYTLGALRSRLVEGVHSPNRYRVIGTLSNSVEFAEAWGCPPGSPMNPENKCVLW
ncbi:neprilysin-4-like [Bacillus rossius redtenbacheri]|uniref:neprilysin-4-like n=1 Tax=Bacillus rossius redtenbacheri TaxID=93214 RepID=UPI002FDEBE7F